MSSGKSKLSAKTGALTQKDLDSFLALHVTAATDVYLQQLAHEVRRSHAAEERVKTLELELLAADAALSRATESVNERDHVLTHCYSQISELNNEVEDLSLKLYGLMDDICDVEAELRYQIRVHSGANLFDTACYIIREIGSELAKGRLELNHFLEGFVNEFNDDLKKGVDDAQLFDKEMEKISNMLWILPGRWG